MALIRNHPHEFTTMLNFIEDYVKKNEPVRLREICRVGDEKFTNHKQFRSALWTAIDERVIWLNADNSLSIDDGTRPKWMD